MTDMVRVRPAADLRVAFAGWAVGQDPKIRTCSEVEFAVPAALVEEAPEMLLAGALLDGQPYQPPIPDPVQPPASEPVGVSVAAEPPASAQVSVPPAGAAEPPQEAAAAPTPTTGDSGGDSGGVLVCGVGDCDRTFRSERARSSHRRQAHPEGEE